MVEIDHAHIHIAGIVCLDYEEKTYPIPLDMPFGQIIEVEKWVQAGKLVFPKSMFRFLQLCNDQQFSLFTGEHSEQPNER